MSSSDDFAKDSTPERAGQIRHVVAECIARRSAGEPVSDQEVIASHAELLPELAVELSKLRLVERARGAAVRPDVPASSEPAGVPPSSRLPDRFDGYELVREIHAGGQGVVYEAIQKSTKRKVAIKVLHGGPFVDARSQARLAREIEILSRLDHPNIVRIHDSGCAAGCPYYVMDYISGEALDDHIARVKPSIAETLHLFARLCDAVHAAHLRGVIHRDLKPGNVRVDANGEPHVLDFGLAKAALGAVTDGAAPQLVSLTGQFVGSLPWASPEQAAGLVEQVDVRTDVYALGVVLYHMLTGHFPYEVFGRAPDVLDHILHADPVRPRTLRREIDEDVETILLKCLEKDRERRYQSAGELARDVRHYLAGEPIEARRASMLYLLSKSLRRYRAAVAVGAVFLVVVLAFAVAMTVLYRHAQHEARKAELVAGFLDDVLTSVDPGEVAADRDSPLYAALRQTVAGAAARLDVLGDEPEVEARVRHTLGSLYMSLGSYGEAEPQLRRAVELRTAVFGPRAPETAAALFALGWCLKEQGRFDEAEAAYAQSLAIRQERHGPEHLVVAECYQGLGQLRVARQEYDAAEADLARALELTQRLNADPAEVATCLANLGSLFRERGRLSEAEPLLREALRVRQERYGPNHPHTLVSLNKLALLLRAQGDNAAARALLEQYIDGCRQTLGEQHAYVAAGRLNLGLLDFDEGDYVAAEARFRQAADGFAAARGPAHPDVTKAWRLIAEALRKQGRLDAALEACDRALAAPPAGDVERARGLLLRGQLLLELGEPTAAEAPLRESCDLLQALYGPDHPGTSAARAALTECRARLNRTAD